jgi:large subunit ribosomal protein L6
MSRIGRMPIKLPKEVTVSIDADLVTIKGPKGVLNQRLIRGVAVNIAEDQMLVSRESDARWHRAAHGLTRTLLANMVTGVSEGFEKSLELVGVGYRAQQTGTGIILQAGYSHPVEMVAIDGTTIIVEANNRINVQGIDKQRVGEMAARIRSVRPPNVYTGKGVKYLGEHVRRKPGKSAGRAK